jgi:hypothetical protein
MLLLDGVSLNAAAKSNYEKPPVLKASKILPADLVSGPYHRLDSKVQNDGYINTYTMHSTFGRFKVESTALLRIRVHELQAIAAMKKVQETDEFNKSIKEAGGDIVEGGKSLITKPTETIKGAVTGVGKLFERAHESLFESQPSKYEDSRTEALIGFSKTKREYAAEFKVDVYSTNPVLQDHLNEISWAGYAGGLSVSVVTAAIPGGAGLAVSAAGGSDLLNEVIAVTPPSELRLKAREKLTAMKVNKDLIDLFIDNSSFSPRHQALIVAALEKMPETVDRGLFVKYAVSTDSEEVALFNQQIAQMQAGYYQHVDKIEQFIRIGGLIASRSSQGKLIVAAPLDYVIWNKQTERIFQAFDDYAKETPGIKGKEWWLTGILSPMTHQILKERGWQFHERCEKQLLKTSP